MSIQNSSYSAFATLLASSGHPASPAELHGLLLGRSCAGAGFELGPWIADATELLGSPPQDAVGQALAGLQAMVKEELTGTDMAMVLLLPSDETALTERTFALGQWCQGFLGGFGLTAREGNLSAEALEVLRDIAAVAQVQGALEESEDAESDYMEVMEYLRVAPLLLFAECAKHTALESTPALK